MTAKAWFFGSASEPGDAGFAGPRDSGEVIVTRGEMQSQIMAWASVRVRRVQGIPDRFGYRGELVRALDALDRAVAAIDAGGHADAMRHLGDLGNHADTAGVMLQMETGGSVDNTGGMRGIAERCREMLRDLDRRPGISAGHPHRARGQEG